MDKNEIIKPLREVIKEELNILKKEVATKEDLRAFATKEDLRAFATKEDLKAFATKEDFMEFEKRMSSALHGVREGVRLSLIEVEQKIDDIRSRLRFYDFDFLAKQNDKLIELLQHLYQEKTVMAERLREHERRLEAIESKIGS